jgi:hypothetical protein
LPVAMGEGVSRLKSIAKIDEECSEAHR